MEGVIRGLRPHVEVRVVQVRALEAEVGRFDPHLVVCGLPNTVDPGGRAAWLTLSEEPDDPSEVCLGGRRTALENPGLDELLLIIDQTEDLVRTGGALGGC